MVVRQKVFVVALVGLSVVLSGCSTGNVAFRVSSKELEGAWSVEGHPATKVTIEKGGVFTTEKWPLNVYCKDPTANVLADIDWRDTVDASGNWNPWGAGLEYQVTFQYPKGSECDAGYTAVFWRNDDGTLEMKVELPSITDPDSENPDGLLVLHPTK